MFLRQHARHQEVLQSYRHPVTRKPMHRCIVRWSSGRPLDYEIAALENRREEELHLAKNPRRRTMALLRQRLKEFQKKLVALEGGKRGRQPTFGFTDADINSSDRLIRQQAVEQLSKLEKQLTALRIARDGLSHQSSRRVCIAKTRSNAPAAPDPPSMKRHYCETFYVRMMDGHPLRLPVVKMTPDDVQLALAFQERELAIMAQIAEPVLVRLRQAIQGEAVISPTKLREANEVAATLVRVQQQTERLHEAVSRLTTS